MYWTHKKRISFLLAVIIFTLVSSSTFFWRKYNFEKRIKTNFCHQYLSFDYYLKPGDRAYKMIIGDLNGLNNYSFKRVTALISQKYGSDNSWVIVPSVNPEKSNIELSGYLIEDVLNQIANSSSVVIVDNFCVNNWEDVKKKSIYSASGLTPGPFCFSEKEPRDVDWLISAYNVEKVYLVYDAPSYMEFVENFLAYLRQKEIQYEFVKSEELEKIEL